MKLKTIYKCQNCAFESSKWVGKCPSCEAWNTFIEDVINVGKKEPVRQHQNLNLAKASIIQDETSENRITTDITELDNVLGGGFKEGSVTLLSGEPGIGKSTLTLQICQKLAEKKQSIFYISGEESVHQIASRAKRLNIKNENISIITENNLEAILDFLEKEKPGFVIIDSIQVINSTEVESFSGSINQIKYCTEQLMTFAKKNNIPLLIIGHVTKEGGIAGPRVLEHLVDTVLFLEGERFQHYRILRGFKNRFGSTNEIGIFEMGEEGLTEVKNPSKIFLEGKKENAIGSAITVNLEGNRPILLEVQALTNTTVFGYPKRTTSGFDLNRLQLLSAVIQKHLKLNLSNQDIYINVVGGFKLNEPANDLSIIMAIISSFKKIALPEKTIFLGEVGLSGELRSISNLSRRIQEAEKLGFEQVITSKTKEKLSQSKIKVTMVQDLEEAMKFNTLN